MTRDEDFLVLKMLVRILKNQIGDMPSEDTYRIGLASDLIKEAQERIDEYDRYKAFFEGRSDS